VIKPVASISHLTDIIGNYNIISELNGLMLQKIFDWNDSNKLATESFMIFDLSDCNKTCIARFLVHSNGMDNVPHHGEEAGDKVVWRR